MPTSCVTTNRNQAFGPDKQVNDNANFKSPGEIAAPGPGPQHRQHRPAANGGVLGGVCG
jgi:hypothetical protein